VPLGAPGLPGFLLEGFEEGDDKDNNDEDKRKGCENGAGLEPFESTSPEEDSRRKGLNDAPGEFNPVGRVEVAIGGQGSFIRSSSTVI